MSRYTPNQPLSRPFPKILARLRGVKRTGPAAWMAICPAHADHDPSLSVRLAEDGRTLLHCFAGCALASIITAVNMTVADLSPDRPLGLPGGPRPHADPRGNGAPPAPPTSPVRGPQEPLRRDPFAESRGVPGEDLGDEGGGVVFTYRLMDGRLAPRHHRRKFLHEPKGWTWTGTKEDGDLVPYGLWKLDMAREQDQLLLVEGETDTLTAWHHGIPALGLPGADMAGLLRAEYLQGFSRIFVVHAAAYANVLKGSAIGVSVGVGNLPDEYGYLDAYSSSRTTCSGAQIVEKPSRSAVVATVLTHSGATVGPMQTAKYPTSIKGLHGSLSRAPA